MRKRRLYSHPISGIFVYLVLGVFAVVSMVMVLVGSQSYRQAEERASRNNANRLASAYIKGRLREADASGMLQADDLTGSDMLRIDYPDDGTSVILYVYNGMLYDWHTLTDLADRFEIPEVPGPVPGADYAGGAMVIPSPNGEMICPMDELHVSGEGQLLTVRFRQGETWTNVEYTVRSVQ